MIFTLSIRRCCRSFSLVCRLFPFLHPHPALLIRLNPFPSCPTTRIPPSSSYPHHPRQRRTVNILLRGRRNSVASPPTERFAASAPLPRSIHRVVAGLERSVAASFPSSSPARSCGLRYIFLPALSPAIANWPVMR